MDVFSRISGQARNTDVRPQEEYIIQFSARITPSNATRAHAFAGKARRKQGTKPLHCYKYQYRGYTFTE